MLWFDLDGHFDITRLLRLLQAQVHEGKLSNRMSVVYYNLLKFSKRRVTIGDNAGEGLEQEEKEHVVKACMERFYYTRCYSSLEFITALKVRQYTLLF